MPILSGPRVRLEPLELSHLDALCAVGLDPALWEWTSTRVRTRDDMHAYVAAALADRDAGTAIPYATVSLADRRVVGSTRFGSIDRANRRAEIGWTWVAVPWQRTAVNTEAKLLMLAHAFDAMRCLRVELKTDARNAQSRAAILRLGAVEEGTLRSHMVVAGGRVRDSVYFSVLAAEWPAVRRGLEERLARQAALPSSPVRPGS